MNNRPLLHSSYLMTDYQFLFFSPQQKVSSEQEGAEEQVAEEEVAGKAFYQAVFAVKGQGIGIYLHQTFQCFWSRKAAATQPHEKIRRQVEQQAAADRKCSYTQHGGLLQ